MKIVVFIRIDGKTDFKVVYVNLIKNGLKILKKNHDSDLSISIKVWGKSFDKEKLMSYF